MSRSCLFLILAFANCTNTSGQHTASCVLTELKFSALPAFPWQLPKEKAAYEIGNVCFVSCFLECQEYQCACQQHNTADLGFWASVAEIFIATGDLAFRPWNAFCSFAYWVIFLVAEVFGWTRPGIDFRFAIFSMTFQALIEARRTGHFFVSALIPGLCIVAFVAFQTYH